MHAVHVAGTQHLIDAASGRIGRWVQLSSVGAYGRQRDGVVTEQTESHPLGTYEVTKVLSDELVSVASHGGAFEHAVLRPSNVYGAEMSNQSLFGLINMIRRGRFFFIGAPGASANYIHVDNVVEALMLCGTRPEANGRLFNLSDHRTLETFVAVIADALGTPAPRLRLPEWTVRLPAKLLGGIPGFPLTESRVDALTGRAIYSTASIEQELGYRHAVAMEDGLKELVHAWQQRAGV
jgi:nucleoside-diphosphate-sugar epimerase